MDRRRAGAGLRSSAGVVSRSGGLGTTSLRYVHHPYTMLGLNQGTEGVGMVIQR